MTARTSARAWKLFAAAVAVLVLIGLGSWQLVRLGEKNEIVATAEARLGADPVAFGDVSIESDDVEFVRASLTGEFAPAVLFMPGASEAGRAGLNVMSPFLPADADGALLVDRGWVPLEDGDATALAPPSGEVSFVGVLRVPLTAGWMTPGNDPARNLWHAFDGEAMAEAAGVDALLPVLVRLEAYVDAPDGIDPLPERGPVVVDLANDHLEYALTWYALALALIVIAVIFFRRRA